jgi:hypothetical protein
LSWPQSDVAAEGLEIRGAIYTVVVISCQDERYTQKCMVCGKVAKRGPFLGGAEDRRRAMVPILVARQTKKIAVFRAAG